MKKGLIFTICLAAGMNLSAQSHSIEDILESIEANNKELQASSHLAEAQKLANASDNNLPDPSVSYAYQYGKPGELGKTGELVVSQGFDFPTLYGTRNKLNGLKAQALDRQYAIVRRDILLQAKELCMDIIHLNRQKELLEQLLDNAEELAGLYEERLETGDANIIEYNSAQMQQMKARADLAANHAARLNLLQSLSAMNGDEPVELDGTAYPPVEKPGTLEEVKQRVLAAELQVAAMESEAEAARKQVALDKSGWLPSIEVGYRRNTGVGEQFNGFIIGGSLPLFSNRHKVKAAKAQALSAGLREDNARLQAEAAVTALYHEAASIRLTMDAYDMQLVRENSRLLEKALKEEEISTEEYLTQMNSCIQAELEYVQLENQYQKAVSRLFKNEL